MISGIEKTATINGMPAPPMFQSALVRIRGLSIDGAWGARAMAKSGQNFNLGDVGQHKYCAH